MELHEWKNKNLDLIKSEIKEKIQKGEEVLLNSIVTESFVQEAEDELSIETFKEIIEDFEEFEFEEPVICEETNILEYVDFVPDQFGEEMDLELEIPSSVVRENIFFLAKLKEMFFAEDYDLVFEQDEIEEVEKAKVVFSRAKGSVTKSKKCAPGFKLKGNKCVKQGGSEKAQNRKLGIKIKRAKKSSGAGVKKKAALKAKITKKRVAGKARNYSGT